jgi:hypothetical protein
MYIEIEMHFELIFRKIVLQDFLKNLLHFAKKGAKILDFFWVFFAYKARISDA